VPDEDRHSYSRDYLFGRLVMLFGGRVAEEMIFGPEKVTTGAGNDIERATAMARRMVTQFGMSDAIGPMAIGDSEQEVFLGRDIGQRRQVSEQTAQLVDGEVKRLLDEAYEQARVILTANQGLLDALANGLLERETLDREQVEILATGASLPPIRSTPPAPEHVGPTAPVSPKSPPLTGPGMGDLSPSVARVRTRNNHDAWLSQTLRGARGPLPDGA
jgi:cell division protease FtsH